MRILMVCLGNICRSPLAEGILKEKSHNNNITVDSAGTSSYHVGNSPDKRAIAIGKKNGIDISYQKARKITTQDFDNFDILYAMDKNNYLNLISLARNKNQKNKVRMILNELKPQAYDSVPDPYYGGDKGFQDVYDLLNEACDKIIKNIE